MNFHNNVPYTNFHEINLDRIIEEVKNGTQEITVLRTHVDAEDKKLSDRITTNANNIAEVRSDVNDLQNNLADQISNELNNQIQSGEVANVVTEQVHAQVPTFITENNDENVFPLNRLHRQNVLIVTGNYGSSTVQEYPFTAPLQQKISAAGGSSQVITVVNAVDRIASLNNNISNATGSFNIILIVLPPGDWSENGQTPLGRLNGGTGTYQGYLKSIATKIKNTWPDAQVYVIPPFFNYSTIIPFDNNLNTYIPYPLYHHAVFLQSGILGWNFWDSQRMPNALKINRFWNTTYPNQLSDIGAEVVADWIYKRLLSGWGSDPEGICTEFAPLFPSIQPYISGGAATGIQFWNNEYIFRGDLPHSKSATTLKDVPSYCLGSLQANTIMDNGRVLRFRYVYDGIYVYEALYYGYSSTIVKSVVHDI